MRFRTKTILGVAVIEMVLLAVLVGSVLSILRESNEKELFRRVQLGGKLLAASAKDAVISQDLATLDSLVAEAMNTSQIDVIRIVDSGGVVLSERGDKQLLVRPFYRDEHINAVKDGILDWSTPINTGGIEHGQVQLGVSIDPLNVLLKSAQRWAAGIAGLEMVLVAIFSWLLGSYLAHQLGALREASVNIAAGRFGHRVEVKGNDELAETAIAFNQMAQQIGAGQEMLRAESQERLKAQQAMAFAKSEAEDRSEQLDVIFSLSPDGFVSFDAAFRVKYANPAFTCMTGLTNKEIVGLDEVIFSARLGSKCRKDRGFPGIAKIREQQNQASENIEVFLHKFEIAGSSTRVIEVARRESKSASISQILYFRDITHESEVDRMKSEFLSTAAHELRTPMASIYGYSELMLESEFPPTEQREFLHSIHTQSELMISIINELLDLTRIDSRRGKDFILAEMDIGELLHDFVSRYKPPRERAAPALNISCESVSIKADKQKIFQVLNNILTNAYKYSPSGGPVRIDVDLAPQASPRERGTTVAIRITDPGIGMTPAQLGLMFERFYRADTSGKFPGTGLGMSIVKEIIEIHDGKVTVESDYGKGTAVTVWLDVLPCAA